MKKYLILLTVLSFGISAFAFDYVPKNADTNPFGNTPKIQKTTKTEKTSDKIQQPEMREIKNLTEYFRYLPAEVNRHWVPYKSSTDYQITVQFTIHRNGTISEVQIVGTNCPAANPSVLKAVKSAAPYQPLPQSYKNDSVKAQVILEYHAKDINMQGIKQG